MSKKSVICLASSRNHAEVLVDRLKDSGFSSDDISVLLPDKAGTRDFAHEKNTKAPEGAATGAGAGGVVGGTVGLLAGIGLLAVPGLGPFLAAGPIMAALSGAAVGATVGGVAGGLIGLGIPEYEARRYEGKLKEGGVLISVHTENSEEITRARGIMEASGGKDIANSGEAGVPSPEADTLTPSFAPLSGTTTQQVQARANEPFIPNR